MNAAYGDLGVAGARWAPTTIPGLEYDPFSGRYRYEGQVYDAIPRLIADYTPGSPYWMPTEYPNIFYNAERKQYFHRGNGKYTTTLARGGGHVQGSGTRTVTGTGTRSIGAGTTYPGTVSVGTASDASNWPPAGASGQQVFVGPADIALDASGRRRRQRSGGSGEELAPTGSSPYLAVGGVVAVLGALGAAAYFLFRSKRRAA